jgi:peptidoglycan/LPS O-acetylase OafA/YrhL
MPPNNKSPKREIELDFIRGIAILLVLDFHYKGHSIFLYPFKLMGFSNFGWAGVDLFFVLSGFLVGGLLLKEWKVKGKVAGFRFLKRRAFKIWPAYYFFLFAVAVFHVHPLHTFLLGNLLNIQNYVGTSIAHTWSLAVEEHFYLFLALFMAWSSGRQKSIAWMFKACMAIALGVGVLRTVLSLRGYDVFTYTHTRMDELLTGVMLAILYHFYPERFAWLQRQRYALLVILAGSLVGLYFDSHFIVHAFIYSIANLGCLALFLLLYRPAVRHSWLYRVVAWVGMYSYGIYLWHVGVTRPLEKIAGHLPELPGLQVTFMTIMPFVCAILLGVLVTKLVEFPFLRLRERMVPPTIPEPVIPEVEVKSFVPGTTLAEGEQVSS